MDGSSVAKRRRLSAKGLSGCVYKGLSICSNASVTKTKSSDLDVLRGLCGGFSKGLSACKTEGLCGCVFKGLYDGSKSLDVLTDHLLLEILLRFPVKFLHRCKSVSKRWFSLISSPSFTRSFILTRLSNEELNNDPPNKMLLFKIQHMNRIGQVCVLPLLHDDFNQVSSSLLGSLPSTFDFIPALGPQNYDVPASLSPGGVTERSLRDIHLKCTYGGLVLLEGVFQDWTHVTAYDQNPTYFYYYYVCNPVTKQWVELPFTSTRGFIGFACYHPQPKGEGRDSRIWADIVSYDNIIKHNANFDPNKIEFTVVSINRNEKDDVFTVHVFSSTDETTGWSIFNVHSPPGCRWLSRIHTVKVLFINGKFHWCGDNCIVAYDPFNKPEECDIIPLPPMDPLNVDTFKLLFLEACKGSLRLVSLFRGRRFLVWELVDYANKAWVKTIDVNLTLYEGGLLTFQSFVGGAVGDKIYMQEMPFTIKLFDLRNKSLQHVYTYPINLDSGCSLQIVEPFFSSPWPTPVPQLRRK